MLLKHLLVMTHIATHHDSTLGSNLLCHLRAIKHCEHIQHTKKQIQVEVAQHGSPGRKLEKPGEKQTHSEHTQPHCWQSCQHTAQTGDGRTLQVFFLLVLTPY